ncbi:MAG: alpha/beta fold hydrolase [Bacteroidales bacterium]|nr:alpha/beta fold hydrolase [Bacteroidales bacterium]
MDFANWLKNRIHSDQRDWSRANSSNISSGGPGGPIYDRNIKLLAPLAVNGFDVYLYDQIGCGSSARLENIEEYSVERHRRDLEEIVKPSALKRLF